jgi:DNA ligase-associated metallophosphoesterase
MPSFDFALRQFETAGGTALFWPAQHALIVADLHLEKASWFAARGQMLPPHDSMATLQHIAQHAQQTKARAIWCLGDNFHDVEGPERLTAPATALLASLTAAFDWVWITGNHDAVLPPEIGGRIHDEMEVDGILFRHRAEPAELRPEVSGHFHPKYRAQGPRGGVTRPCFVSSATKLILPAFGAFTGGLAADHPEIAAALAAPAAALLPAGDRMLRFPL